MLLTTGIYLELVYIVAYNIKGIRIVLFKKSVLRSMHSIQDVKIEFIIEISQKITSNQPKIIKNLYRNKI